MDIQLQTVLEPDAAICSEEALYFHRKGQEICYDGYFNLFYIEKWKRYTRLEQLKLVLDIKGYQQLRLYHDHDCIQEIQLNANLLEHPIVDFPWEQYDNGVFWFSLIETGRSEHGYCMKGFFWGECCNPRHAMIGVDICTYKREAYVLRNLKVLCEWVLQNDDLQVSEHLRAYLIDNGRTLNDNQPIQEYLKSNGEKISVIPNKNAGGTGGFTRGMIEVLNRKDEMGFTHVLLMDDDAVINPDLFVRIYGFLRVVKEEWKDITLGGTMLREDKPYELYAAGEAWAKGVLYNDIKNLDLRTFDNASSSRLLTTEFEKKHYSAWWCCCYSLDVVRDDNLPIPLFIHQDDTEYGLRNILSGVVFLNGVNVWHKSFENTVIGSNLYYDFRNAMIQMTQQCESDEASKYICRFYWKRLAARLLKGSQADVWWTIRSAEDFLKGPEWLWSQNPEQLHNQIRTPKSEGYVKLWCESVKIFVKLCLQVRKLCVDYQKNTHSYENRQAWMKYLNM